MRIKILSILFAVFFIFLSAALFYFQIVKGSEYKELSYKNSIRLLSVPAPRGVIYDRVGEVLAGNRLSFGVYIVPQEARGLDKEMRSLAGILGVPEGLLERNYKRDYRAPFAPCELLDDIDKQKAIFIEELKLDMPGVLVRETPMRFYAEGGACAHVVGYTGEIDRWELEALRSYGYSVKDMIGKDGIERVADKFLRGRNGGMQIQIDHRGRQVKILNFKRPEKGRDVYLTIDAGLQRFLWKMMKKRKGASIFMDARTGEILAMVSTPSFDPNESIAGVLYDAEKPLLNRAIMGQYAPGSLFKIVVALSGLESGRLEPHTSFMCRGTLQIAERVYSCWDLDGHGLMDLREAIVQSCNIYFYNAGLSLGVDLISEHARRFGFGRRTGIELYGEKRGLLPSRSWKRQVKGEAWFTGDTANLSIGQGYLLVTPLQMVRFMAAVANGGGLVTPHLVKKIGSASLDFYKTKKLKVKREHLEFIRGAMKGVVEDIAGTGSRAWSDKVSISAKTGTAQTGMGHRAHAWFCGFAPSEEPEICFVVFLEHGGSGGDMAALIARKAVEYWYKHKNLTMKQ